MQLSHAIIALTAATSVGATHAPAVNAQTAVNTNTTKANVIVKQDKVRVVQPGDTLSNIAVNFGSTYQRVFDANTFIKNPDLIYPGQRLRIPSASEHLANRPIPGDTPMPSSESPQIASAQPAPAPAPTQPTIHASYQYEDPSPTVTVSDGSAWDRLAACESGGDWSDNTGNGFYGGLQFTLSSWRAVGGQGLPSQASEAEQIARAQILEARQGWGAWPVCSVKAGLR